MIDLFNNTVLNQIKNNKSYLIIKACNFKKEYLKESDNFISYFVKKLDYALENSIDRKIYLIVDVFDFKTRIINLPFVLKFVNTFKKFENESDKYKDIFKRIVVINYNPVFKFVFNFVKGFVDKKKIEMVEFINKVKKKDRNNENVKYNLNNLM